VALGEEAPGEAFIAPLYPLRRYLLLLEPLQRAAHDQKIVIEMPSVVDIGMPGTGLVQVLLRSNRSKPCT
jgi:hypothetical protein